MWLRGNIVCTKSIHITLVEGRLAEWSGWLEVTHGDFVPNFDDRGFHSRITWSHPANFSVVTNRVLSQNKEKNVNYHFVNDTK